jgi:7-carboxy-7-deazaguanine synthase
MKEHKPEFRYSEIFGETFQGEGRYTGVPTVWYRAWGCNFSCNGFGQEKPEDPSTWILDYNDIDVSGYKSMEDLPVFARGCDSSYSWAKKFAHLANKGTAAQITAEIRKYLRNEHNPEGKFKHPKSGQWTHMAFTGGEPMMSQTALLAIMQQFDQEGDSPRYITIETNGTQELRSDFWKYWAPLTTHWSDGIGPHRELFFSISPKLYLSGELWDNAIKPDIVSRYHELSPKGQLKYVSNGTQRAWDEVDRATELYRKAGVTYPVWIMPVSATKEDQEKIQAEIAEGAIARGYNVAARVHCWVFGNLIGK